MPSSTASSTPRTASHSTARPYANHQKNPESGASLTPTTPSEPLNPSTGELSAIIGMLSAIDRNQCPQSIGTPVRNPRNPHDLFILAVQAALNDFRRLGAQRTHRLLEVVHYNGPRPLAGRPSSPVAGLAFDELSHSFTSRTCTALLCRERRASHLRP